MYAPEPVFDWGTVLCATTMSSAGSTVMYWP